MQEKKITLKIHKKSRFQPNEKMFAESCSVRYRDLLRAKKIFGVIGTLSKCAFFFLIIAQFFEGLDFFQGAKNTLNARSFWKNSVKMSVVLVKAALKYL